MVFRMRKWVRVIKYVLFLLNFFMGKQAMVTHGKRAVIRKYALFLVIFLKIGRTTKVAVKGVRAPLLMQKKVNACDVHVLLREHR